MMKNPSEYSPLVLAYIGDAVYEVYTRERILLKNPNMPAHKLHMENIKYVKAHAQSDSVSAIEPMLTEEEQAQYSGEPDAKAVIFGFTEMINEGIDIDNEENGTDIKPLTLKQVGRLITEIGLSKATETLNQTVVESTEGDESKNV